ncbi:receptor-like serine/threonine-protein kinase NCRK isoform X2 [Daucus carota subsp. sativus]|uniref:receptor-like serine/threonine-protein kinase NCRK isoform X2 n=1 Tax=Daucus carota subsp. sativus TaxID=79200 RepID=UPI0007EFF8FF|nr:PREDICTED: receptor-like serine/threonine-protein kinase NCRK isoform X2 [Daucus carota subsp. sativus]
MKFRVEFLVACLLSFILIQPSISEELSDASETKWACTCSAHEGNNSLAVLTNCAPSCDCTPVVKDSSVGKWVCICAADKLPRVTNDHDAFCFTSCNCKSGSAKDTEFPKRRVSSKVVVIILLLCVALTTLAIIGSVMWYFYRKEKCSERSVFSSDKDSTYNSTTNLISHRAYSMPEFKVYISSPVNPVVGCMQRASFLFRSKDGKIPGTLLQFSYAELENATNKFSESNLIGMGGSSYVYCGHLKDGGTVAIKRMKAQEGPNAESDFLTEIELISRLHHCHVVPLLGFCSENQGKRVERLLVFEYMPNGNLRDYLDGASGKCLDWGIRVAIALGAAKGLEYLHEAAAPKILHRDVKSTNILLDENHRAKITDLGMAKRWINDGVPSCSSSPARMQGTFGYFAPEYAIVGRASLKSDVFSFGVVLLELITGRHPIHKLPEKGEESLVIWATPRLLDSRKVILELPDPHLQGIYPEEEMQIMAYLAKECLLLDPDSRPTMSEVVQILSTIAPEKSRRRNYSINLFQVPHNLHEDVLEAEELGLITSDRWSPRSSLPVNVSHTLCVVNKEILTDTGSLRSSLQSQDEEKVDLTEPRFETFSCSSVRLS